MPAKPKVTKTKAALKQETYNLSNLKHDPHCGFVELGDSVSVRDLPSESIVTVPSTIDPGDSKLTTMAHHTTARCSFQVGHLRAVGSRTSLSRRHPGARGVSCSDSSRVVVDASTSIPPHVATVPSGGSRVWRVAMNLGP